MPDRLSVDKVEAVAQFVGSRLTIRQIAKRTGISRAAVQRILARRLRVGRIEIQEARLSVGWHPLPPGHPLSWSAISQRPFYLAGW